MRGRFQMILLSILVKVVVVGSGREGRNNGSNINIHLPLSHFQEHEIYVKIHGIRVTLIRAQIQKIPKAKSFPPVNLDWLSIYI